MEMILMISTLVGVLLLLTFTIVNLLKEKKRTGLIVATLRDELSLMEKMEERLRTELRENRKEFGENSKENRVELSKSLKDFSDSLFKQMESFNSTQAEKFDRMEGKQKELLVSTEKRLDDMRETVDEKLQKTLNARLSQSFETVGKQLQAVQSGLGEMKTLAQDVGGLKKVLSNVKMRGGLGEIQLEMLLEQILAPDQYEKNVKTKPRATELVEFAIKLPAHTDEISQVWLPIDAKFPKDVYEKLQNAYDLGDPEQVEKSRKDLESTLKKMARDIRDKYVAPPYTTDFGVMFLPFEGIYSEVVRSAGLLDEIQRNYKVIITGPSTLAAILNSLQMGFRTLAIQKRSSEVWMILGAVKTEFEKFGDLLAKAKDNIQSGLDKLDSLSTTRTNKIRSKLKTVEALDEDEGKKLLSLDD